MHLRDCSACMVEHTVRDQPAWARAGTRRSARAGLPSQLSRVPQPEHRPPTGTACAPKDGLISAPQTGHAPGDRATSPRHSS